MADFNIPPVTCPTIDKAFDELDDAIVHMGSAESCIDCAKDLMNEVREANSLLREAAEGYQDKYHAALDEIKDLEQQIEEQS